MTFEDFRVNRRHFLHQGLKASAGLIALPAASRVGVAANDAAIQLTRSDKPPARIPPDFMGLGYEMSSVATAGLLSAHNDRYVRLVRQLGLHGVIRVGGIVADYTHYAANGTAVAEPKNTVITRACIEQFGGFLKAVGWTAIWSVNFAQGRMQEAVDEAAAVSAILGSSLQAFEIGNEVENYQNGEEPFRARPYTYEIYRAEYSVWREAILSAVPQARFAAPDTASNVEWVERMAQDAHGDVQLLTTHYYRNGQQRGSAEQLLRPDPALQQKLTRLRAASQSSGIPWRMCETNSFSGGGKPGVSDTFLGALWTLDFMLLLAANGCSGVNMETGVNQLGFVSSYSPIQDDGNGLNRAGVPYYGMLACAEAMRGCTDFIAMDGVDPASGLTAYAMGRAAKISSLVVINRSDNDALLSIANLGMARPEVMRLQAPAIDSRDGITFAGAAIGADGNWSAVNAEAIHGAQIPVSRMSAAVIRSSS